MFSCRQLIVANPVQWTSGPGGSIWFSHSRWCLNFPCATQFTMMSGVSGTCSMSIWQKPACLSGWESRILKRNFYFEPRLIVEKYGVFFRSFVLSNSYLIFCVFHSPEFSLVRVTLKLSSTYSAPPSNGSHLPALHHYHLQPRPSQTTNERRYKF